ncbi:transposable element Tc1 transposase [Trichonephila clavipes]|nr:transposable element Tc1 transposase [Trichonephila clavipes]
MEPRTCVLGKLRVGPCTFTNESRLSTNSDSRRVFIWREPGTRYHPFNINNPIDFGGCRILASGGIMLNGHTPLHIFDVGSVTAQRYKEVLEPHVTLFRVAIGQAFIFMEDNEATQN